MVSRAIEREHGRAVSMDYIELSTAEARDKHQEIIQLARKKYLRFPLVMLNGELAYHGGLDYYSLSALIKARLDELHGDGP